MSQKEKPKAKQQRVGGSPDNSFILLLASDI